MWKMKTAILLTLLLLLLTPAIALAHEGIGGMVMDVNGYHVRLILPDVVKMGENQFQVLITGVDGLPVSGAQVEAAAQPVSGPTSHSHSPAPQATADDMAGMPRMDMSSTAPVTENMDRPAETIQLAAAPQAGLYNGTISFPKDGAWTLAIHLMIGSKMLNVEFPLDVTYATPAGYGIIAAFLSLNVVIVISAAILKRKAEK